MTSMTPERGSSKNPNQSITTPQCTPPPVAMSNGYLTDSQAYFVGAVAQGFEWVRRRREWHQRQSLQVLAEEQLRKIKEAEAAEKALSTPNSQSLSNNSTFQNSSNEVAKSDDDCDDGSPDPKVTKMVSKSGGGFAVHFADIGCNFENNMSASEEEEESWIPPVRVEEIGHELDDNPFLLSLAEMQQIAVHVLPSGITYCRWKRLYSLRRDGDSFNSCMRNVAGERNTLLVIRSVRNEVFGGFADTSWDSQQRSAGPTYFGGPLCCLFKVIPPNCNEGENKIAYYKWTGANRFTLLTDFHRKMLAFGGGGEEGAFGLALQEDFQVGTTGPCETFANEALCPEGNFEIADLEVFGFLVGQF